MNSINFICNKINQKPKQKYKIVSFSTHEAYQEALAKTGHEFFLIELSDGKKWNERYRKIPKNCTIIRDFSQIPYDADMLLSQERYSQLQMFREISNITRLPLIHLDHVEPIKNQQFSQIRDLSADVNVFITEHNKNSWESPDGKVIPHGIDTNTFANWKPNNSKRVVYTVNYLKDRDFFCGWKEWEYIKNKVKLMDSSIEFSLIGDNPGMSSTINDPVELCSALRQCACYINTSKYSPVPMSLLEAMSCGMPIVSTKFQQVAKLLNETNSISSNDLDLLADGVVNICNNNDKFVPIGVAARNDIMNNFSNEAFIDNWNSLFDKVYNMKLGRAHEIFSIE